MTRPPAGKRRARRTAGERSASRRGAKKSAAAAPKDASGPLEWRTRTAQDKPPRGVGREAEPPKRARRSRKAPR